MGRGVLLGKRVGSGEKGHERAKGRELKKKKGEMGGGVGSEREGDDGCEWSGGRLRSLRKRVSSAGEVLESSESKRSKANEEMMTLAEMQLEVKRKLKKEKENEERKKQQKEKQKQERLVDFKRNKDYMVESRVVSKKSKDLGLERFGADEKNKDNGKNRTRPIDSDLEIMPVEDSDFYDFDKDRVEKSFKQGQVWAIYDDDDGMPRHYGLIDEIVSVNPFEVKMSWWIFRVMGMMGWFVWRKWDFMYLVGGLRFLGRLQLTQSMCFLIWQTVKGQQGRFIGFIPRKVLFGHCIMRHIVVLMEETSHLEMNRGTKLLSC